MAYTSANAGQVGPARGASLDRALRKLFPSTSKLTFNPLFRAAVNSFDVVPRLIFPEFRTLPPNHLRIRIGVGNRILNNQTHFLVHARDFWMFVFSEGIATMHSEILDIGSAADAGRTGCATTISVAANSPALMSASTSTRKRSPGVPEAL